MHLKPGQIVNLRNRLWRVDDYNGQEIVASPIDSSDVEKRTFLVDLENIQEAQFHPISPDKLGDYAMQQLLLRAYRFDLLHGSAPFLSLQKSSVIPYNYQLVPLVMALETPQPRLLIGDDVGLGKTIEAGLIMSELMQRGFVKRVLILTPAGLKEQWKDALDYFFHVDAKIISSFTRKEFEKELPAGANPWRYFNYCIASLDYAKSVDVKHTISEQEWNLLIVDEIHTCAKPHSNSNNVKQMLRYELIRDLSAKISHRVFLSATPHNGYTDSFASILEMLNDDIVTYRGNDIFINKSVGRYNVCQRNRKSLEDWYKENNQKSPFPERNQQEILIKPSDKLKSLLDKVEDHGNDLIIKNRDRSKGEVATWVALHLQKRMISSPFALEVSLQNRLERLQDAEKDAESASDVEASLFVNDLEVDERTTEEQASNKIDKSLAYDEEIAKINDLLELVKNLKPKDDSKLQSLKKDVIPELFKYDNKIIVFTKFKDTLTYLVKNLKSKDFDVFELHGDLSFSKRRDVFLAFEKSKKAVLVATDVIAEGLNLQRLASNVIHYELPWNPNRLEQRNGRVDRIGQQKEIVQIRTFIMEESLDIEILDLLIRKAETIRKDREYSGAYFGDEENLSAMVKKAQKNTTKKRKKQIDPNQLTLLDMIEEEAVKKGIQRSFLDPFSQEIMERIKNDSFYDSINISLPEIDKRIEETKNIVGSKDEVEKFVTSSLRKLGCAVEKTGDNFYKFGINDPRLILPKFGDTIENVSFDPEVGLIHPDAIILEIGHPLVKRLIDIVKSDFFQHEGFYGRTAYYFSDNSNINSVIAKYNALVRYTVGVREKRVIEELLTFGIDLNTKKELSSDALDKIEPISTTERIDSDFFKELLGEAIKEEVYITCLQNSIENKKLKLIEERQELAKKIIKESEEDIQWIDEIQQIETASSDILTVTIIIPHNPE